MVLLLFVINGQSSPAYSVLTHEQIVDMLWHDQIRPILLARYPTATDADLREAHAYAYGGCLIQDIGYYPFGSHFFSDLTHYVRSGDFVLSLLNQAQNLDEYAFALGALAHYASDTAGHPAVNQSVALDFPKLRAKYGPTVTYEDNPKAHIRTEFGFDVVQVARDRFTSDAYHDFIGFEVSRPVLERAFLATYGLKLTDVISNPDLSIGSFRYTVSALIPQLTKVAIVTKRDEILQEDPTMTRKRFLYHLSRSDFERDWGKAYKRPGFVAHFIAFLIKILPHIGPLSTLDIKVPSKATETLYMKSVDDSADHYGRDIKLAASNSLVLENEDFDTGHLTKAGEYRLTDETYAQLLDKLANDRFAQVTPELRANLLDYYSASQPSPFAAKSPKKWAQAMKNLALLKASQSTPPTPETTSVPTKSTVPLPDSSVHGTAALNPPTGARVAIIEFEDMEAPDCGAANPLLRQASKFYNIPFVRHDFPLSFHPWSMQAAVNARWFDTKSKQLGDEYRDRVLANQPSINSLEVLRTFTEKFAASHQLALSYRVDPEGKLTAEVKADYDLGKSIGIQHVPTIFVTTSQSKGEQIVEVVDRSKLFQIIDQALIDTKRLSKEASTK